MLEIDVYGFFTRETSRDQDLALHRVLDESAEGQWRGLWESNTWLLIQWEVGVVVVIALL